MKIIKEGDLTKIDDVRRFECERCGCVFDADSTEYVPNLFIRGQIVQIACACPTCHRYVFRKEQEVLENEAD